jgi:hypothetical protein
MKQQNSEGRGNRRQDTAYAVIRVASWREQRVAGRIPPILTSSRDRLAALENDFVLPVTRRRRLKLFSNGQASNDELVDLQSGDSGPTGCQAAHGHRTNRNCTDGTAPPPKCELPGIGLRSSRFSEPG